MPRWSAVPNLCPLVGTVLLGALALSPAPALADGVHATGLPATADTPDPADSQSPPPAESPTPTPTDGGTSSPPSPPASQQPVPSPTIAGSRPHGRHPVLRVTVYASNAVLGPAYWSGARATSFTITVWNTGTAIAAVGVDYTVPAGLTDAATGACRHGHCSVPSLAPGASVALPVAVTVSADAWRHAPLTGRITVTASAAGGRVSNVQTSWGAVFPPGPPASGIDLEVDDVALGTRPDVPGQLRIKVTNTGALPAGAKLDVLVPNGVGPGPMPAGCEGQPGPDTPAARCELGTLPPAGQRSIVVPLTVDAAAREDSPLAGLVRATLTAAGQGTRTAQASYQILVPASLSGVTAQDTPSAVPDHGGEPVADAHGAAAWPIIVGSTAVLIVAIVGLLLGLRGRSGGPEPAGAAAPDPAASGRDEWWYRGPRLGSGADPVPVPRRSSPVGLEWVELPDSAPPSGEPVDENPPNVAGDPLEVEAVLAEVAADLAEAAAILSGAATHRTE